MSGGLQERCPKCNKRLKPIGSHICIYCGWNYEKEFSGQKSLFSEEDLI